MKPSHIRGHKIYFKNKKWHYSDNNKPIEEEPVRPCVKCGKTFQGSFIGDPDPCLGVLPGVDNACCGHGARAHSYIRFTNGVVVKGFDIIEYTNLHESEQSEKAQPKSAEEWLKEKYKDIPLSEQIGFSIETLSELLEQYANNDNNK